MAKKDLVKRKFGFDSSRLATKDLRQLENCEQVVLGWVSGWPAVARALETIRDKGLYFAYCDTWDEYISKRFLPDITRRHANRLIQSAKAVKDVEGLEIPLQWDSDGAKTSEKTVKMWDPIGPTPKEPGRIALNERQARELAMLDTPQERATVLQAAVQASKVSKNGEVKLSAGALRAARQTFQSQNGEPEEEEEELEAEWDPKAAADH